MKYIEKILELPMNIPADMNTLVWGKTDILNTVGMKAKRLLGKLKKAVQNRKR